MHLCEVAADFAISVLKPGGSLEPIDFDEDSLSGRGLSIINRVADRWWVDMDKGTRVSAELSGLLAHRS